jgi:hypothetical protein
MNGQAHAATLRNVYHAEEYALIKRLSPATPRSTGGADYRD